MAAIATRCLNQYAIMSKKEYDLKWSKENKEKRKEYYMKDKEIKISRHELLKLDHYVVYYLPKEHYCGITNNPVFRMHDHKKNGKDTTDWMVLFTAESRKTAAYYEALFQSTLAIEGLKH